MPADRALYAVRTGVGRDWPSAGSMPMASQTSTSDTKDSGCCRKGMIKISLQNSSVTNFLALAALGGPVLTLVKKSLERKLLAALYGAILVESQ